LHSAWQKVSMKKKTSKIGLRAAGLLLLLYMLSFNSCDKVSICWYCENPHNTSEWQQVCNSMTKIKLESYGYVCTPF
jgi:hypothetical protein